MKYLMISTMLFVLAGCTGHMNHEYNPLGGQITTITPSSVKDNMETITIELKRIVKEQGIKDAYLYWEINGAQEKGNMAVYDITITVKDLRQRFIFGLTDGVVEMVKEIDVGAEVQCEHEAEQYEGRDQA